MGLPATWSFRWLAGSKMVRKYMVGYGRQTDRQTDERERETETEWFMSLGDRQM